MIQRVQSLYILAAFISTLCLFFVPMYSLVPGELSVSGEVFRCGITGVYQVKGGIPELLYSTLPLMLVNGIIGAILIGSILMYKRRTQQVKLVHAALFILLVSNLFQLWSSGTLRGVLAAGHVYKFGAGWALTALIFVFGFLAVRAIRKDEALVRSADRLR